MSLWQILILAVVQGITEFLPISSDGHLVVVAEYLKKQGTNPDLSSVVISLHMGTLLSILVYYWKRILTLLTEHRRVIGLIIIATIPAIIVGLPIKKYAEHWLESPLLAGICLPITGLFLLWGERQPLGKEEYHALPWWKALLIGCAQATAILPGLSRSGSTIPTGLALGLTRESAATFSFLMAIPALLGAGVLECLHVLKDGDFTPGAAPRDLVIGAVVSFLVGLGAIDVLIRTLQKGRLRWFAVYCILLGIAVIIWQLTKSSSV
jgi:undecaprenyl-diphosphatase